MADSPLQSLRDAIDEKIAGSGPVIRENAINHFAELERRRRVDIVVAAVVTQRDLEADLRKINRPDHTLYDEAGAVTLSHFTKDRLNQIKKLKERIAKLSAACDKALTDTAAGDDFDKLEKAVKAAKSGGGNRPAADEEEAAEE